MGRTMFSKMMRTAFTGIAAMSLAACATAPQQSSTHYEATITRTTFGIAHIKASDFGGLGFGSAYSRAQDNLCLLADSYVSTAGERSKYFGANGKALIGLVPAKNIDSDVFNRAVVDIKQLREAFSHRSADYKELVDGWVAGYNRYLNDNKGKLPAPCGGQPWVREITRDDVLLSLNSFSMLSSSAIFALQIANSAPPSAVVGRNQVIPAQLPAVHDGASIGSNGWAFGGDATSNGKGLVLGNPHFPWFGPNRFYETHYTIPGKLDVAGAAILNLPYVGIGFNRDVAWTHTVDMAAHMTLYKLALDPKDATAYFVDGKRETMKRRDITIVDKDGPAITRAVYETRFGPIVSVPGTEYAWTASVAYAVADANRGNIRSGDTWLGLSQAHSVEDIRKALADHIGAPFINTIAADRHGKALYADITTVPNVPAELFSACGSVHNRLPGQMQDLYILDGSRSACAWATSEDSEEPGLLPASKMATLYRHDYVQNSNDSYRWSNPAAPMKLDPIMGRDPGLGGLRTRAAIEEISGVLKNGKFDIDAAAHSMLSNKWLAADLTVPALLKLCTRKDAPTDACAALRNWDRQAQLESKGAMLFNLFWGKVGARADIWDVAPNPDDPLNTPRGLRIDGKIGDELLAALAASADGMKKLGLAPDVALGKAQFAERGSEHIPISGAQYGGVLNYTKTMPVSDGFSVFFGSSYIQSVTFDEQGPVAKAILTYSQSTDPASPYYADQTREFSKLKLHRFPFTDAEIAAETVGAPLTIQQ